MKEIERPCNYCVNLTPKETCKEGLLPNWPHPSCRKFKEKPRQEVIKDVLLEMGLEEKLIKLMEH